MKKIIISGLIVTVIGGISIELFKEGVLSKNKNEVAQSSNSNEQLQVQTIDKLAYEILESLQNGDWNRFQRILPTKKDVDSVIELVPKDKKAKFSFGMKKFRSEFGFHDGTFKELIEQGRDLDINWNNIENVTIQAKIRKDKEYNLTFTDNIFINFEHDNEKFLIRVNDSIKAKRGWVLYDYIKLTKSNN